MNKYYIMLFFFLEDNLFLCVLKTTETIKTTCFLPAHMRWDDVPGVIVVFQKKILLSYFARGSPWGQTGDDSGTKTIQKPIKTKC